MEKETFTFPLLEVINLAQEDIITTSDMASGLTVDNPWINNTEEPW